jgi:hypothetical protein
MLLGNNDLIAEIFYILSICVITFGFLRYYQSHRDDKFLIFAAAIGFTLLITPHAMIYDWSLLLIPAIILWNSLNVSKILLLPVFTLMWIGSFISGPLAYLQLKYLPIAFQISVPIFIFSTICLYAARPNQFPTHTAGAEYKNQIY